MRELPKSEVYEQEFRYMSWGIAVKKVLETVENNSPKNASVLDLMCGPGYLLGELSKKRKDLLLEGIDNGEEFIQHAQQKYPEIPFHVQDVLSWNPEKKYDVIVCTAGIHHLPYEHQEPFLKSISQHLNPNGFAVFADPFIDDYSNEMERKQGAAKLGYEYLLTTINNDAPIDVISAALDVLHNDVMKFEYKTSVKKLEKILKGLFSEVEINKTWPDEESWYGDYYSICKI